VTLGGYGADGGMETSIFIYRYACNHWTNITSLIHSGVLHFLFLGIALSHLLTHVKKLKPSVSAVAVV
jgi:hypothetical protein